MTKINVVEKIKLLHWITLAIILYAFVNAFLIGVQISPDFKLITLPFSYVAQFLATTVGLLTAIGFLEFGVYSAREKGVGKFSLAAVMGLVMGIIGLILEIIILTQNYSLGNAVIDRWLGGFLTLGAFVVIIVKRQVIFKFGKAVTAIGG